MIILEILDVSKEQIFDDYLMSNDLLKNRNEKLIQKLIDKGYSSKSLEAIRSFIYVTEKYLLSVYAEIEEKNGSIECFLCNNLLVDENKRKLMKNIFLY